MLSTKHCSYADGSRFRDEEETDQCASNASFTVQRRVHSDTACIHELKYRSDFAKKKIKKRKRSLSEQMYSLL